MNRRSFFNRLKTAAIVVALAPQIAFRVNPKSLSLIKPSWTEPENVSDFEAWCLPRLHPYQTDVFDERAPSLTLYGSRNASKMETEFTNDREEWCRPEPKS